MSPDLSIILVSWNTRELSAQCLAAIPASAEGLTYEVIVVDNASSDGSVEMIKHNFANTRLIANSENIGFARANNQAIAVSRARHIVLLNTDTIPQPGALANMVSFLDAHPDAGIAGAHLLNPNGSFQFGRANFLSLKGETLQLLGWASRLYGSQFPSHRALASLDPQPGDWVNGACLMIRREAAEAIGPLDEGYFMYTEETDWCYRAKAAGWAIVYLPTARVIHFGGQSAANQPAAKRNQLYASKVRFFRKHRGALVASTFSLLVWSTSALKMGYWFLISLMNRERRPAAQNNIRAYLTVLGR